jgi:threonine dehydratase
LKSLRIAPGDVRAIRAVVAEVAARTPLVPLPGTRIFAKLETRQPTGSFKIRGAHAQIRTRVPRANLTASAGNLGRAAAWCARRDAIACTVVVPQTAPEAKTSALAALGARLVRVPYERWWRTLEERAFPGTDAAFLSPFDDPAMVAANGTIGLEIAEDLSGVRSVVVPWGGGGLACGVAVAVKALQPQARVYAAEVSTAAPLAAAWRAGRPVEIRPAPSFVDGIGTHTVFPHMFDLARTLLDGVLTVPPEQVAAAVRRIHHELGEVAEGAGAVSVAAALAHDLPAPAACVVSGSAIEPGVLDAILRAPPAQQ